VDICNFATISIEIDKQGDGDTIDQATASAARMLAGFSDKRSRRCAGRRQWRQHAAEVRVKPAEWCIEQPNGR